MNKSFHIEKCCSWEDFLKEAKKLHDSNDKWVFRGHEKPDWSLKSTLERACERFGIHECDRARVERRMIREFQRRLHHYTANVPDVSSNDEWMALMQHHGAPTRLVDFTYSPYVAAYFAFEAAAMESEVGIWAVNTDWCERELISISSDNALKTLDAV